MSSNEPTYDVLWPLARCAVQTQTAAARTPDLSGKTVAELWDHIFRGDAMFARIREALRARYPGIRFVGYEAFGDTHGAGRDGVLAALPDRLRELGCDAVISGVGA